MTPALRVLSGLFSILFVFDRLSRILSTSVEDGRVLSVLSRPIGRQRLTAASRAATANNQQGDSLCSLPFVAEMFIAEMSVSPLGRGRSRLSPVFSLRANFPAACVALMNPTLTASVQIRDAADEDETEMLLLLLHGTL